MTPCSVKPVRGRRPATSNCHRLAARHDLDTSVVLKTAHLKVGVSTLFTDNDLKRKLDSVVGFMRYVSEPFTPLLESDEPP